MIERTFVMVKPDGVRRALVGEIISTFERAGLRIVAMKMLRPTRELVFKHYPESNEWFSEVGEKTIKGYKDIGLDVKSEFGTDESVEIGKMVKEWLKDFISSGDVVAMVLEGNAAVINVRRLCGGTFPIFADPGSIRGRFSVESPDFANAEKGRFKIWYTLPEELMRPSTRSVFGSQSWCELLRASFGLAKLRGIKMTKSLFLVRHGKAQGQQPEASLTPEGLAQALRIADILENSQIQKIISSPFTRAVQSIEPLANRLALKIELDERLVEANLSTVNYTDWLDRLRATF